MPAWLRKFQQSYAVQTLLIPALIAGATVGGGALLTASGGDISTLGLASLKTALGVGGFAALAYVIGVMQHGPGSPAFKSDGTKNQAVANVVATQQAATAGVPGAADAVQKVESVTDTAARAVKMAASTVKDQ